MSITETAMKFFIPAKREKDGMLAKSGVTIRLLFPASQMCWPILQQLKNTQNG